MRDIQKYLHLSFPQSIYRWFKGKILPSVEHLCALSRLLNVHMEEFLVLQEQSMEDSIVETPLVSQQLYNSVSDCGRISAGEHYTEITGDLGARMSLPLSPL